MADVVQAYYDAGRRPANNQFANPPVSEPVSEPEAPAAEPETPVAEQETLQETLHEKVQERAHEHVQDTVQENVERAGAVSPMLGGAEAPPVRKSLGVLADELEAFIEAIRYGDNLGSADVLSGAAAS